VKFFLSNENIFLRESSVGFLVQDIRLREYPLRRTNTFAERAIPTCMRPEERERMYQLCAMIEKEQDRERFLQLIRELNDLLERKEHRLERTGGDGR
jgi:hypothetical protein